ETPPARRARPGRRRPGRRPGHRRRVGGARPGRPAHHHCRRHRRRRGGREPALPDRLHHLSRRGGRGGGGPGALPDRRGGGVGRLLPDHGPHAPRPAPLAGRAQAGGLLAGADPPVGGVRGLAGAWPTDPSRRSQGGQPGRRQPPLRQQLRPLSQLGRSRWGAGPRRVRPAAEPVDAAPGGRGHTGGARSHARLRPRGPRRRAGGLRHPLRGVPPQAGRPGGLRAGSPWCHSRGFRSLGGRSGGHADGRALDRNEGL
ncbi:MAG: Ubiquinol-cytochrome C reductase, diheme cytochrome cc subunit, partial [uncultured Acidimicrobiales bacterium]